MILTLDKLPIYIIFLIACCYFFPVTILAIVISAAFMLFSYIMYKLFG